MEWSDGRACWRSCQVPVSGGPDMGVYSPANPAVSCWSSCVYFCVVAGESDC